MSFFAITTERIATVSPHPGADRLDIATLEGMSFPLIVGRGQFKPGDAATFFPVDSLLPPEILAGLGLTGKLHGAGRNRVKTMKLRGVISQGLVCEAGRFPDELLAQVTKYEAETAGTHHINLSLPEHLAALPVGVEVYDLEGCQRHARVLDALMDVPVFVTEKLEGTNIGVTSTATGGLIVNQRRFAIREEFAGENDYWKAAKEGGLLALAHDLRCALGAMQVTIRGELIGNGLHGNIYGMASREIRIFDVQVDGRYLNARLADRHWPALTERWAPTVSYGKTLREVLSGRSVADYSNGPSLLNPKALREGIVIRPLVEMYHPDIGRLILKQRSPEYLAGSDL